jgi:hypothetical protein
MRKILIATATFLTLASPSFAGSLITNGGFETGDLTGWTVDPFGQGNTQVVVYSGNYCCQGATPPQGMYAAAFGGGGNVTGEIAQEFATTPGVTYYGSLQYAGVGDANDGNLQVTVGDANSLTPLSYSGDLEPRFDGTWSTYTFQFTAISTLSGIDIVSPNGADTDYMVDNVIVGIPEPSSVTALCGLGAMSLILIVRRRHRVARAS